MKIPTFDGPSVSSPDELAAALTVALAKVGAALEKCNSAQTKAEHAQFFLDPRNNRGEAEFEFHLELEKPALMHASGIPGAQLSKVVMRVRVPGWLVAT